MSNDKPKLLLPKGMTEPPEYGLGVPPWITAEDMEEIREFADIEGRGKQVRELREIARVFLYAETNSTAEKAAFYAFKHQLELYNGTASHEQSTSERNS